MTSEQVLGNRMRRMLSGRGGLMSSPGRQVGHRASVTALNMQTGALVRGAFYRKKAYNFTRLFCLFLSPSTQTSYYRILTLPINTGHI